MKMKFLIYLTLIILINLNCKSYELRNGDIIFQSSKSNQSKAVELATRSPYSHMGIIYIKENNINKTHLSCLFDKGLRFEFNIVLHQDFLKLDSILPIYDPNDILSDIGNMDLSLSPSEYGEVLKLLCYIL